MATTISQLGVLDADRGAPPAAIITPHTEALAIRLRLSIPQAMIDLRFLAACRADLGPDQFAALLTAVIGDTGQANTIMSLLDHLDAAATHEQPAGQKNPFAEQTEQVTKVQEGQTTRPAPECTQSRRQDNRVTLRNRPRGV
jgi:hypothetical protein